MILIADSGSTKCDWALVKDGEMIMQTHSMGFNPYFHDETLIANTLRWHDELKPYANQVSKVYYYGAGCSSKELKEIVARALAKVFPGAEILVDHDLNGAAYATYCGVPEIACILGTGSNSCYFDGREIYEEVPALAYILGDEGSGSYYGKKLLAMYLYKQLPAPLHAAFEAEFKLNKDIIMEQVYMKPNANVYLASFMKFIGAHRDEPLFVEMVSEGMEQFLKVHVCCYQDYERIQTNFVGSVAFHFENLLRAAAAKLQVNLGHIIKKPIDGLVRYHLEYFMTIE